MKSTIIKALKKSNTPESEYGYWTEAATLKVNKSASFDDIVDEIATRNRIGEHCNHSHDCCGCVSRTLRKVQRNKRGEVYAKIECSRNI